MIELTGEKESRHLMVMRYFGKLIIIEIGSLPEKEFRVMIVKMIQNLGNRMERIQETFNKIGRAHV